MIIEKARPDDRPETVAMLADAFAGDPNMTYLFGGSDAERRSHVEAFFDILMSVRLELGLPVYVLRDQGRIGGMVMGRDLRRPDWPSHHESRWQNLQAQVGAGERFARHDAIVDRFSPDTPQYYLGVLGVHPSLQGKGAGRMLVSHFCGLSDAEPASTGVSIETGNPRNARYYENLGFKLMGTGELDAEIRLYVLFRPRS